MNSLDNLDKQILRALQSNCRLSTEKLGDLVGLSATACQRRIKKLRELKVIDQEIAILNPQKLGTFVTVIVDILFRKGDSHIIEEFKTLMRNTPAVQQCYYLTGDVDFSLVICVSSIQEYEMLSRKLFVDNENISKFVSRVSMENVKTSLKIPI